MGSGVGSRRRHPHRRGRRCDLEREAAPRHGGCSLRSPRSARTARGSKRVTLQKPTTWTAERNDFVLPLALHVETPKPTPLGRAFDPSRHAMVPGIEGEIGKKALLHRFLTCRALQLRFGHRLSHITPCLSTPGRRQYDAVLPSQDRVESRCYSAPTARQCVFTPGTREAVRAIKDPGLSSMSIPSRIWFTPQVQSIMLKRCKRPLSTIWLPI